MSEKVKSKNKCPLCGFEFQESDETACKTCPMSGSCTLVRCPNCGYEFIPGVDER